MATYTELFGLMNDSPLRNKITVAVGVSADAIRQEAVETENHANRLIWAKQAFETPQEVAKRVMWSVIIANKAASVATIQGATDAAIQNNVNDVINMFATGA